MFFASKNQAEFEKTGRRVEFCCCFSSRQHLQW